jgi:uncharacterized membrane protein (DUF106 family)
MNDIWLKYGISGFVIAGLTAFIYKLMEWHRKDRKEWQEEANKMQEENRKMQEKQFDRLSQMNDESNRVMRDNTNILSGLKSLLENNRK